MFVGRHAELARLNETLAARKACLIVGTAGIGKTALMRNAATASGARAYEGGGLATLSSLAYLPIVRALGRELPDVGAATIAAAVRRHAGRGVLLVDDLQWADDGTLQVLERLVGEVPLLLAVRRGDPAAEGVRCDAMAVRSRRSDSPALPAPPTRSSRDPQAGAAEFAAQAGARAAHSRRALANPDAYRGAQVTHGRARRDHRVRAADRRVGLRELRS